MLKIEHTLLIILFVYTSRDMGHLKMLDIVEKDHKTFDEFCKFIRADITNVRQRIESNCLQYLETLLK